MPISYHVHVDFLSANVVWLGFLKKGGRSKIIGGPFDKKQHVHDKKLTADSGLGDGDSSQVRAGTRRTGDGYHTARSWRLIARILSGAMDKELGVREDSPGVTTFSEDFLLILSLVSEDARVKAETHLREGRNRTPSDLDAWHYRRTEVREALVKQGRIRE